MGRVPKSHFKKRLWNQKHRFGHLCEKNPPYIHLSFTAKTSSISKSATNSQKLKAAALKLTGLYVVSFYISLFSHSHGFLELLPFPLSFICFPRGCFLIFP